MRWLVGRYFHLGRADSNSRTERLNGNPPVRLHAEPEFTEECRNRDLAIRLCGYGPRKITKLPVGLLSLGDDEDFDVTTIGVVDVPAGVAEERVQTHVDRVAVHVGVGLNLLGHDVVVFAVVADVEALDGCLGGDNPSTNTDVFRGSVLVSRDVRERELDCF